MGAVAATSDLLRLADKLDQIDKQDFQSVIDRASRCTRSRDFPCVDQQLQKAAELAHEGAERDTLAAARRAVVDEKKVVAREEAVRVAAAEKAQLKSDCAQMCPVRRQYSACVAGTMASSSCDLRDPADSRPAEPPPSANAGAVIAEQLAKNQADYARIAGIHNQVIGNIQAQQNERLAREQEQRGRLKAQQKQADADRRTEQREQAEARSRAAAREQADAQRASQARDEERARTQREAARRSDEREQERVASAAREQEQRKAAQASADREAASKAVRERTPATVVASAETPARPGGNSGKRAMQCVDAVREGNDIAFRNICNVQIFVVWCGDLKYSKKHCGDGPAGNGFFTHSTNVKPGETGYARAVGEYRYAACEGGIAFGKDEIQDKPDGSYVCVPGRGR